MAYLYVGASTSRDAVPCQSDENWDALLAAMASDNAEEILRITLGSVPRMFASAELHNVAPPPAKTLGDLADAYWGARK